MPQVGYDGSITALPPAMGNVGQITRYDLANMPMVANGVDATGMAAGDLFQLCDTITWTQTVPDTYQLAFQDALYVYGSLSVYGRVRTV